MAIALVASVHGTPGINGGASGAIDSSGANLLTVGVAYYAGMTGFPLASVTDSKGNTPYTALTNRGGVTYATARIFYFTNTPTVGSSHTFTTSGNGSYPVINGRAWSGAHATAPFDAEAGGGDTSSSNTSQAAGSVTPAGDNEVLYAFSATSVAINTTNETLSTGFTGNLVRTAFGSGVNLGMVSSYEIQTTATARNFTASGDAGYRAVALAAFKAAAGGGGPFPFFISRAMSGGMLLPRGGAI